MKQSPCIAFRQSIMTKDTYAEIAPNIPLSSTARQVFTYTTKEKSVDIYSIVEIPFGRQKVQGTVIRTHNRRPPYQTKGITSASSTTLTDRQVEYAQWLSENLHGGLGFTLRLFMPPTEHMPAKEKDAKKKIKPTVKTASLKKLKKTHGIYIEKDFKKRRQAVLHTAEYFAREGKQTLIIVPEVWMMHAFEKTPNITYFHGGLTPKQTSLAWHNVKNGNATSIIGTQKALFLPFKNLGIIIVEEEQHASHKLWDQYPRLHNKVGVEMLKNIYKTPIIYTTSFPSLEMHQRIKEKEISVLQNNPVKPHNTTIPLSFEDKKFNRLFPNELISNLKKWRRNKERILILYNQRGAWKTAICRKCKKPVQCKNCNASMTIHMQKKTRSLMCKQCNAKRNMPSECQHCKVGSLRFVGFGTEIVEHVLDQFPAFKKDLVRLDGQTVTKKSATKIKEIIQNSHIILGTSALFTRIDDTQFDRVVWLFPERSMRYPDYRSHENAFLMRGRLQQYIKAGRAVTIVTRFPPIIEEILTADVSDVVKKLLKERKHLKYPPFQSVVKLTLSARSAPTVIKEAEAMRKKLDKQIEKEKKNVIIRGPYQGFRPRNKGKAFAYILMRGKLEDLTDLHKKLKIDTADILPQQIL